ncbi:MAG TPA: hypothetical protein VF484_00835 [Candidatus Limnocylindrales bacterium]
MTAVFDHYDAHGLPVACDKAEAEIRELRADEARWEETVGDLNEKVIGLTRALARAEETAAEARREIVLLRTALGHSGEYGRWAQGRLAAVRAVADEIAGGPEMRSLIADKIREALAATATVHGPACNGIHYAEAPATSEPEKALVYAGITPSGRRDHLVWIAALRREIDYHQHADERLLRTKCGRSTSAGGVILPVDKAVERYAARPCPRCDAASGSGVDAGPTTGDTSGEEGRA